MPSHLHKNEKQAMVVFKQNSIRNLTYLDYIFSTPSSRFYVKAKIYKSEISEVHDVMKFHNIGLWKGTGRQGLLFRSWFDKEVIRLEATQKEVKGESITSFRSLPSVKLMLNHYLGAFFDHALLFQPSLLCYCYFHYEPNLWKLQSW